ncbi:uncharacterized protein LOC9656249 [Selaginella moellendorffii]|uniref:uncharacterized protein LOC9656249 n=1 Tax=Selaginella moellendorffii TaxID=88036 RepID=UPI000D1CB5B3|nr:uncharacterized protein LOC9656249 [Selaginella moellendorffii]|eukprot:XP_024531463.1 uncharacterized protein LOC9656249 [Selaginella moellendorffii]
MVEAATEKAFAKRQKTTTSYVGIGRQGSRVENASYRMGCIAQDTSRSDIPGSSDKPDYSFRTADTAALSWSLVAFVMELKDELAETGNPGSEAGYGRREESVYIYTTISLGSRGGIWPQTALTFLRDPPPELIELIDSISDKESDEEEDKPEDQTGTQEQDSEAGKEENDSPRVERIGLPGDTQGTGPKAWYGKKRIRKEHLETFEKVFQRTKRPTGALIQNIVELTHVPRKRVLDWFENRRQEHAARKEENRHLARK